MSEPGNDPQERVRTPLLTLLSQEALEQDYQMVDARRRADGREGTGPTRSARVAVLAVVAGFGLLVAVAAVQNSRNADIEDASRATLINGIENRREVVGDLQRRLSEQRRENAELEDDLVELGNHVNGTESRATQLAAITGFAPVVGDGIRIELDNAPEADPETEYIRDSDLTLLVDALWAAGAEAVSINGQRLTAKGSIRNSGSAIEVNSVGIAPPYTVLAIGDVDTLAANVAESPSGLEFLQLVNRYGFSFDSDNATDLRLPAAPARLRPLRSAEEAPTGRRPEGDG